MFDRMKTETEQIHNTAVATDSNLLYIAVITVKCDETVNALCDVSVLYRCYIGDVEELYSDAVYRGCIGAVTVLELCCNLM